MTRPLRHLPSLVACAALFVANAAFAGWETPGANNAAPAPVTQGAVVTSFRNDYFQITHEDVAKEINKQLQLQAIEKMAEVSLTTGTPNVIYSANHPLQLVVHALQIDPKTRRWQAQANILSNGKTETVKPISGTYASMVEVPVLKRQVSRGDLIEAGDLETKPIPERQLRKDTVTDAKQLIGQSPRMTITADRPIRLSEISSPLMVKRGQPVELTYSSTYMKLKATGTALQDGARGDLIRVKNDKSEKAVTGRVADNGRVEVNQDQN